jgi:hypothetical protein
MRNVVCLAIPLSIYRSERHTRAQAIADSVLVDATAAASRMGFNCPVAITAAALGAAEEDVPGNDRCKEFVARAALLLATVRAFQREGIAGRGVTRFIASGAPILAEYGRGDAGEPVVTIMLPSEF